MDILYLIQKEGLRRGLSQKTIKTYKQCVKQFLNKCNKPIRKISKKDVKDYIDCLIGLGVCGNTINVHLCSLKFMLQEILGKSVMLKIRFSKTPKSLPTVLTKEEVVRIINSIENKKHKLLIKLMYSAGLRVGEVVRLKPKDLELDKGYGWVRRGKGNKDRLFIIAKCIKYELSEFVKDVDSNFYIFKGNKSHLSVRSVQEIVKKSVKESNVRKKVHPHTFRHSFATHLIEDCYDIAAVQFLLGHSKTDTTMIYVHMASPKMISVISPLDRLDVE